MSQHASFLQDAAGKAADDAHRGKILRAIGSYSSAVSHRKDDQFVDWEDARRRAGQIKAEALDHLPDLLERFEARIRARGAEVLWAEDAEEARRHIFDICGRHGVRRVVKSKSMTTEELDLNEAFESHGIEPLESDLGELIVQLAGEKPYHIVTPAMHKSKEDIAELFERTLGTERGATAEELALAARRHLREGYVTAGAGITGANYLIADDGAVVLVENEGNARLSMSCPPVHVVIAGIEKVLPRLVDLSLFLPLLATSGTGQQVTCYNTIIRGPRFDDEPDGPEHLYVILLDNGRTRLFGDPQLREALRCIRCGACLNACPVYRTVGGHTYRTTYQGPIGSVITPHLRDLAQWSHLSQASSLCGACTDVCPVDIDLHHLLLENRWRAYRRGAGGAVWRPLLRVWAGIFGHRARLDRARRWWRRVDSLVRRFLPASRRARLPQTAAQSFADQWRERRERGKS